MQKKLAEDLQPNNPFAYPEVVTIILKPNGSGTSIEFLSKSISDTTNLLGLPAVEKAEEDEADGLKAIRKAVKEGEKLPPDKAQEIMNKCLKGLYSEPK